MTIKPPKTANYFNTSACQCSYFPSATPSTCRSEVTPIACSNRHALRYPINVKFLSPVMIPFTPPTRCILQTTRNSPQEHNKTPIQATAWTHTSRHTLPLTSTAYLTTSTQAPTATTDENTSPGYGMEASTPFQQRLPAAPCPQSRGTIQRQAPLKALMLPKRSGHQNPASHPRCRHYASADRNKRKKRQYALRHGGMNLITPLLTASITLFTSSNNKPDAPTESNVNLGNSMEA